MTLAISNPLTLPPRNNSRQNRRRQRKVLPLAYTLKLAGYPCFSETSVNAHKQNEMNHWLRWRAEQLVKPFSLPKVLFACFFTCIIAITLAIWVDIGIGTLTLIVGLHLSGKHLRRSREKKLNETMEHLARDPRFGWFTVSYKRYQLLVKTQRTTAIPPEVNTMVSVVTSRLPGTKAEVEWCGPDPILWFEYKKERYPCALWA